MLRGKACAASRWAMTTGSRMHNLEHKDLPYTLARHKSGAANRHLAAAGTSGDLLYEDVGGCHVDVDAVHEGELPVHH